MTEGHIRVVLGEEREGMSRYSVRIANTFLWWLGKHTGIMPLDAVMGEANEDLLGLS